MKKEQFWEWSKYLKKEANLYTFCFFFLDILPFFGVWSKSQKFSSNLYTKTPFLYTNSQNYFKIRPNSFVTTRKPIGLVGLRFECIQIDKKKLKFGRMKRKWVQLFSLEVYRRFNYRGSKWPSLQPATGVSPQFCYQKSF